LKWAEYFEANNIRFAFFSAANAKALQESRLAARHPSTTAAEKEAGYGADTVAGYDDADSEKDLIFHENSGSEETRSHSTADHPAGDGSEMDEVEAGSDHQLEDESVVDIPAQARARAEADLGDQDPRIRVLSVLELEELFITCAPDLQSAYNILPRLTSTLILHRFFTTRHGPAETCGWPSGLSECRQVKHHQRSDR